MTMYPTILKRITIVFISLLTLSAAQAQQTKRLTLQEAIDLGMSYNKQLKVSQTKVAISGTKYKQELGLLAPNVAINSSVAHNSENIPFISNVPFGAFGNVTIPATTYNYYLNSLNISQVVFAGLRGWNTLFTYRDQIKAAKYDLDADKMTVRNNIIISYYNHYKLTESKKVVDQNIQVTQLRLKDVQNMQTVGMALKNDVLQVQVTLSNLQQGAADVQSAIDISNYNMDVMLGLPDTTKIEIVDAGLISDKADFNVQNGLLNALQKRPEIKAADVRLDLSHKALRIARGMYSPVISGGFNFYYNEPNQREFFVQNLHFKDSWDIGVKLSWNITGLVTTQFQTKEAKLNIQQAEAQHEQLNDNIRMEVHSNYSAYMLALDKIKLSTTSVDQALENQRMTKDQYANGVKNLTDMLNADNLAITTQINLVSAKIDAEIAYAKLMKSTGN